MGWWWNCSRNGRDRELCGGGGRWEDGRRKSRHIAGAEEELAYIRDGIKTGKKTVSLLNPIWYLWTKEAPHTQRIKIIAIRGHKKRVWDPMNWLKFLSSGSQPYAAYLWRRVFYIGLMKNSTRMSHPRLGSHNNTLYGIITHSTHQLKILWLVTRQSGFQ